MLMRPSLPLRAAIALSGVLVPPAASWAQAPVRPELRVRVLDSAGVPIPFASVTISGIGGTFSTDLSGWSIPLPVKPGSLAIAGRAIGFRPATLTVVAAAGEKRDVILRLTPAGLRLPELETRSMGPEAVRAQFYQRVRRFGGRVVTREAIERSGAINPMNALGTTVGVRIHQIPMSLGGPYASFSGCGGMGGGMIVAIDGREVVSSPVPVGELWFALGVVRADELDLIEVYQRYDQVPPMYRRPGICGALLLWTTEGIRRGGS